MNTIYAGAAPIRRLGKHQFNMLEFALRYPGWHSLGGTGSPHGLEKRTALSLERRGVLELAKHSGDYGRDWQFRFNQAVKS